MTEIAVESIESWLAQFENINMRNETNVLNQLRRVQEGQDILKTPDGKRWKVLVSGRVDDPKMSIRFDQVLFDYVIDHFANAQHTGPQVPMIFFEMEATGLSRTFCMECRHWIDLEADAKVFDELDNRNG